MESNVNEAVNHPSHYGDVDNPYETIKVIEAQGWGIPFCLANVLKYTCRAEHKGNFIEDMEKARWYCEESIKQYKKDMDRNKNTVSSK